MLANESAPIPEVFALVVEWATSNGARDIKGLPGCWEIMAQVRIAMVNCLEISWTL